MKEHITYTDLLKQNTLLEVPDERPPLTYTYLLKQNALLEVPDERAHYLHRPTQTEYST